MSVVDVWAQHPTRRFLAEPFFDSLKRWTGENLQDIPLEYTVHAMRSANVGKALLSAWHGPHGPLISNEEVLETTRRHPDLFVGIASVDLRDPVAAVRTLREYVTVHGFKGLRIVQWLWELPCTHALCLPAVRRLRGARRPGLPAGRVHRAAQEFRVRPAAPRRAHRPGFPGAQDRPGAQCAGLSRLGQSTQVIGLPSGPDAFGPPQDPRRQRPVSRCPMAMAASTTANAPMTAAATGSSWERRYVIER